MQLPQCTGAIDSISTCGGDFHGVLPGKNICASSRFTCFIYHTIVSHTGDVNMLDKSLPFAPVIMVKRDADNYPRFDLPAGYRIECHIPGREREWAEIMASVGEAESVDAGVKLFGSTFSDHPEFIGHRNLFAVAEDGCAVATASLWEGEHFGIPLPRVHWVACRPDHQGRGLIKALLTALLDMHNELSLGRVIYLTTQTWSYKAIGLYKKYGFEPYTGAKPANWTDSGNLGIAGSYEEYTKAAWQIIDSKIAQYEASRR
jgi:GNAT superfamily N-acetyltransferase